MDASVEFSAGVVVSLAVTFSEVVSVLTSSLPAQAAKDRETHTTNKNENTFFKTNLS